MYLKRFDEESKEGNMIDIELYGRLVELDTKLGTSSSEQLCHCLPYTSRREIIEVYINRKLIRSLKPVKENNYQEFLDYRLETCQ